ncbi:MAG: 2-hydroxyacyl-CoA dehydratase [Syntrophobacteraceae bacterium]|nr:2-hydroxyacyl-CoA dehydratase [Syntrophobacteraceae bacterium]
MSLAVIEKLTTLSDRNLMDIDKAKENGVKVAGIFCMYAPKELVLAAGAIPVSLCGTRNEPVAAAEKILPRNLCPLIKSSFGFAVTDSCPFFHASDLVIGETTCDGKKKMFELLKAYRPVHVMQLPHNQDPEEALPYWRRQIELLKERIEREFKVQITPERLSTAIRTMNRERLALKDLMDQAKERPSRVSGLEMLTIKHRLSFLIDKEEVWGLLREAVEEVRQRAARGESPFTERAPRILLTGTPVGLGSEKVLRLIEESGAGVVVMENCSGYKKAFTVEENGDPIGAIAKQYLQIHCSCMSPNPRRYELLGRLIEDFQVDGVVDLGWQACHTYLVESYSVQKFVEKNYRLPFLQIETDYSEADSERLRVRIEAFLEMTRQ